MADGLQETEIGRINKVVSIGIAINTAISDVVDKNRFAGVAIAQLGSTWTAADVLVEVSDDGTNFQTMTTDEAGTICRLSSLGTGKWNRPLPDQIFAWPYFRLRSVNTGLLTDANQAAARTFSVCMMG